MSSAKRLKGAGADLRRTGLFVRDVVLGRPFVALELSGRRWQSQRRVPAFDPADSRLHYQSQFADFGIEPTDRVLDVGSGDRPFRYATDLLDSFPARTKHRASPLAADDRPLYIGDVEALPFSDGAFDFVYCSHVLEHVDDPVVACRELMRVGRRGYIETPTAAKDMLFNWHDKEMTWHIDGAHKWHVVAIGSRLCFFEYNSRQLEGVRCSAWRDIVTSPWLHPLRELFARNQDAFNVMFVWEGDFHVSVFYLDGDVRDLSVSTR